MTIMNSEIALTQRMILDLYRTKRAYLNSKPTQLLHDLRHEARDMKGNSIHDFSARAAAEINHAAAEMILQERGHA